MLTAVASHVKLEKERSQPKPELAIVLYGRGQSVSCLLYTSAKDAKLDEAMNAKEKGSFAKLTKGKKADLAQGIIEADHDYSEFAPSWYLAHVKPK